MFSHEALLEKLETITNAGTDYRDLVSDRLQVLEFGPYDFNNSSGEEYIIIHRGSREDLSDALGFWLASLFSRPVAS